MRKGELTPASAKKTERFSWKRPDKEETGAFSGTIGTQKLLMTRDMAQSLGIEEALDKLLAVFADQQEYDIVTILSIEVSGLKIMPHKWMILQKKD